MKQLIYIFIAALLMGYDDGSRKTDNASATTPYDSIMQSNGYHAVPLFKTRTGHVTVTLQVNGKPCVFLVDTGGGATLIDISKKVPTCTPSRQRLCSRHRLGHTTVQDNWCFRYQRHRVQERQPVPYGHILPQCRVQEDSFTSSRWRVGHRLSGEK